MMKNKRCLLALLIILCTTFMLIPTVSFANSQITASVTAMDAISKTVTITVSENVEGSIGELYIYNTETGDRIEAEGAVQDLNKIVISYTDKLAEVTEHAIVFVDDVYGTSGVALADKYIYFTTDSSAEPDETTVFDYDLKSTTASGYQSNWASAYCDEEHGKAMQVTAYSITGNMDNDLGNISYYSSDKWAVSFDLKIVKSPAAFGILLFGENNTTPTSFGFGKSRAMFRDNMWWSFDQLGTDIDRWFADSIFSDYKVGEWVNYKAVYDKNANLFTVYEDGVQKLTVTPMKPFNKLTKIRISMRNQNIKPTQGETLIWLDNLTLEKYPAVDKVEKIRICDLSGNSVASPQTTKRDIEKIDITFLCDINKASVTNETVKLLYGTEEIPFDIIETDNTKVCTIKPSVIPENGDVITVNVSGVKKTNGNIVLDYTTKVTVSDEESGFIASGVSLVDSSGNEANLTSGSDVYIKSCFANKSSEDKEVMLIITGYTEENSLEAIGCKKLTVPANSLMTADHIQNIVKLTLPYDGSVITIMGSANVLENGLLIPLTEATVISQGM